MLGLEASGKRSLFAEGEFVFEDCSIWLSPSLSKGPGEDYAD